MLVLEDIHKADGFPLPKRFKLIIHPLGKSNGLMPLLSYSFTIILVLAIQGYFGPKWISLSVSDRTEFVPNCPYVLFISFLYKLFDLVADREDEFGAIDGVYSGDEVAGLDGGEVILESVILM